MKNSTLLLAFALIALPFTVKAQDTPALPRIALTEAPKNNHVYELMGEFVGPITVGENKYEPLGIQIRPIGADRFEALQYSGGLPGQRTFDATEPVKLFGHRSGDFVVLSGGPWAIFVEKGHCLILDRHGKRVGRLDRIHRGSPTMGAKAPKGATVLFDGTNTDQFTTAKMTEEGLLMEGADTLPMFQDFDMHVEFRLPYMPNSDGQKRGNSGCYLQSRYEVQVLDSFAQVPVFNGCSALYRFKAPDLNMCYPPLQWQTYDIHFTSPRWGANGKKLRNGRITVWQNGVKTHDDVELPNKTGAGKPEEPNLLPHRFQNHSDPVRYRNIWVIDRGLAHAEFPVYPKKQAISKEKAVEQKKKAAVEKAKRKAEAQAKLEAAKKQAVTNDKKQAAEVEKRRADAGAQIMAAQKAAAESEKKQAEVRARLQAEINAKIAAEKKRVEELKKKATDAKAAAEASKNAAEATRKDAEAKQKAAAEKNNKPEEPKAS
ncbi:MAG: family 16 glycoside hydrolase [Planctomycetota bacterium]